PPDTSVRRGLQGFAAVSRYWSLLPVAGLGALIVRLLVIACGAGMDRKGQSGKRLLAADLASDLAALVEQLARRRMPDPCRDVVNQLLIPVCQHPPVGHN